MEVPEQNCDVVKVCHILFYYYYSVKVSKAVICLSLFRPFLEVTEFYMYGYLVLQNISHING